MAKLKIEEIPKKQHATLTRAYRLSLTGSGIYGKQVVEACGHVFTYQIKGELRFGPPYFGLQVKGPHAKKLNKVLKDKDMFYSGCPYDGSSLYFFEEAADYDRLRRRITVYDLKTGRKSGSVELDFTHPWGWRPGSDELALQSWGDNSWKIWRVRSRKVDRIEHLHQGCSEGHISADGRFMIINETGIPLIVLLDLSKREKIHELTKKDFKIFVPRPQTINPLIFDPRAVSMDVIINWSYSHRGSGKLNYESAVRISIDKDA
jgi:hypothetical protein